MAGLGERGKKKASSPPPSAKDLFQGTTNANTHEAPSVESTPVKKSLVFPYELAEDLRQYAFVTRRTEVDIVREALADFFAKNKK